MDMDNISMIVHSHQGAIEVDKVLSNFCQLLTKFCCCCGTVCTKSCLLPLGRDVWVCSVGDLEVDF